MPKVKLIITLFILTGSILTCFAFFAQDNLSNGLKFIYISDLNLYPTPSITQSRKHDSEKSRGLLIYESQAIFQEIIRYINQKIDCDAVIFGGNNIYSPLKKITQKENVWQLFLDMASEIKSTVLIVLGDNELKTCNIDELIHGISLYNPSAKTSWWTYELKDCLFIGLDSSSLFNNKKESEVQLNWLSEVLLKNKQKNTLIFLHKSLIDPEGNLIDNQNAKKIFDIIKAHNQVKFIGSGNELINRAKLVDSIIYVISPSPSAFPCSFKYVEINNSKIKIRTIKLPLKGIIKKAEQYLVESDYAIKLFPSSPKLVKQYVSGDSTDTDLEISY